ncbi:Methyltransferase domain-containing protein [Desulfofundulus australicus DSM 11792]|uniref:Methyltransferase domain-containing protein n=1 Tax=Desulfofundulus australicus DSM 11792 TaxID=1121425 RepID=A0A1M5E070_9FIRM|nr:class I SAM-dependent methyltransferase [Desulfofundulus australicus]SHF72556.1 Methyltransferase domain-containing protein [Desulfofundulus australicus DSM 11792]
MPCYADLAWIYDLLVSGVDYEGWIDYLEEILRRFNYHPCTVLDLACGTGNTTLPLARRGYQVTGLDLSPSMINVASKKAIEQKLKVNFLTADMRSFELEKPVDLVICFHDGLNYLADYKDMEKTFRQVRKNLVDGGMFVFDLNTIQWLAGSTPDVTVIDEPEYTIIWRSRYYPANISWEIELTAFIRKGEYYHKFIEQHREYGYTADQVRQALKTAGLKYLASYDAFSFNPVQPHSRRHFYVAQRS